MKNTKNISALTLPQVSTETRGRAFVFADFFNMGGKIEIWKDVVGYEGLYKVSNLGNVMSMGRVQSNGKVWESRILKEGVDSYGYLHYGLTKNKKTKTHKAHRLVAIAFISNADDKPSVNHIDGDKKNNKANNLEWVTNIENLIHAHNLGLRNYRGEKNPKSKLTENEVKDIINSNDSIISLSKTYNVSYSSIRRIKKGDTWTHINK